MGEVSSVFGVVVDLEQVFYVGCLGFTEDSFSPKFLFDYCLLAVLFEGISLLSTHRISTEDSCVNFFLIFQF